MILNDFVGRDFSAHDSFYNFCCNQAVRYNLDSELFISSGNISFQYDYLLDNTNSFTLAKGESLVREFFM